MCRLKKRNKGKVALILITGSTLVEILIVVVIVGILATIAIPSYSKHKEKTLDSEAKATLKLIQASQKIYYMDYSIYAHCPSSPDSCINDKLKLSIPKLVDPARSWSYITWNTGYSQATRNGNDSRTWYLAITDDGDPQLAISGEGPGGGGMPGG